MIIEPDDIEIWDRFAIAAMSAIVANYRDECAYLDTRDLGLMADKNIYGNGYCETAALAAYEMADKMLFERQVRLKCSNEERDEKENADHQRKRNPA